MKTMGLIFCALLFLNSCRTVATGGSGSLKQSESSSTCDAKALRAELSPGGIFASRRVLYNQPRVEKSWIHPLMIENTPQDSLGLFHNFIPDTKQTSKIKKITSAISAILKDIGATKSVKVSVTSDVVEFKGPSDVNVFAVDGGALMRVRSLKFDVNSHSSNVVVLMGQTPSLNSVSITGGVNPENLLFVLPEAGTFRVLGDKFFGTVVAPRASVFMEASFTGSIFSEEVSMREPMKRSFYTGCFPKV